MQRGDFASRTEFEDSAAARDSTIPRTSTAPTSANVGGAVEVAGWVAYQSCPGLAAVRSSREAVQHCHFAAGTQLISDSVTVGTRLACHAVEVAARIEDDTGRPRPVQWVPCEAVKHRRIARRVQLEHYPERRRSTRAGRTIKVACSVQAH